jgi:hypothetical protein
VAPVGLGLRTDRVRIAAEAGANAPAKIVALVRGWSSVPTASVTWTLGTLELSRGQW